MPATVRLPVMARASRSPIPFIQGGALIAAALALGVAVRRSPTALANEFRLNVWLNDHFPAWFGSFSVFVNWLFGPVGAVLLLVVSILAIYWRRRDWSLAARFTALALGGWVVTAILKAVFREPRPALLELCPRLADGVCEWLVVETGTNAFPSGHTAFATGFALAFGFVFARGFSRTTTTFVSLSCCLLVLLVAFTRVYLGVHYLTDTIGAVLVTVGTAVIVRALWPRRLGGGGG